MTVSINLSLRALYLGSTDNGVKVHSRFLETCDVNTVFASFKKESISTDNAPFFIDLFDEDASIIKETIGVTEETYSRITGEVVLTYDDYQRADRLHEDALFGAMQELLREKGIDVPENTASELFDAALAAHRFRKQDHVMMEVGVDDLSLRNEPEH
ncbi:TPA: hypothetical protein ACN33X_001604 [Vibrio parahaemolyticus]